MENMLVTESNMCLEARKWLNNYEIEQILLEQERNLLRNVVKKIIKEIAMEKIKERKAYLEYELDKIRNKLKEINLAIIKIIISKIKQQKRRK